MRLWMAGVGEESFMPMATPRNDENVAQDGIVCHISEESVMN